jgi:hypothetical protein
MTTERKWDLIGRGIMLAVLFIGMVTIMRQGVGQGWLPSPSQLAQHWYTRPSTMVPLSLGAAFLFWLADKVDSLKGVR